MSARSLLSDPGVDLSVAWDACQRVFGKDVLAWEPDTFRIELHRLDVPCTPGLLAKILGAQTLLTTPHWLHDYDVFFAFALACDGVPSASDAHHHPTPEQISWAMREVQHLLGRVPNHDEGFDPDDVDPAIAVVLAEAGFFTAPDEVSFVQPILDRMTFVKEASKKEVISRWETLRDLPITALHRKLDDEPESVVVVQLHRLADVRSYINMREETWNHQHASLSG